MEAPVACNSSIVIIYSEGAAAVLRRSSPQVAETILMRECRPFGMANWSGKRAWLTARGNPQKLYLQP